MKYFLILRLHQHQLLKHSNHSSIQTPQAIKQYIILVTLVFFFSSALPLVTRFIISNISVLKTPILANYTQKESTTNHIDMASSSKLQVAGNQLRVGCEIETLLSLVDAPASSASEPPSKILEISKFVCETYGKLPEGRRSRSLLHPNFGEDLPYDGPMYRSWILTGDSTIRGRKPGLCKYSVLYSTH